ncbi:MAG: TolC family protein [Tepidisphaeraceae bacterium]
MVITNRFIIAPVLAALVGGCAAVKPHESFPAVSQDIADRIPQRVHWHDGSAADRQADEQIAALLVRPLDVNAAVQVALLNNRHLQATYEALGVAQADLVEAGLLKNPVFDAAYKFGEAGATGRIDLALSFDFVDLLFIGARKQIAAAELETAKARVTASVIDLAGEVRQAFYACQAAGQSVELRTQVVKATAASADFARRLREAGNTTALANANEQALHVEAELELDRAKADAASARTAESPTRRLGRTGELDRRRPPARPRR